jgi:hypothetical protein
MADIVIRGMEMPKEGNWKTIRIYPDGTCAVPNWQGDCTFLPCIAIPLPEGHGNLIDVNAPIKVTHHDGTIHETTPSRLLCKHSMLDLPKIIIPAEKREHY